MECVAKFPSKSLSLETPKFLILLRHGGFDDEILVTVYANIGP